MQRTAPSNNPEDGNVFSMMLEDMSVDELTDALNDVLENMSEENFDPTLLDAYLDALDHKDPMLEILDAETSYASFQKRLLKILPGYTDNIVTHSHKKSRRVWRAGLVAVLTVICMLGGMIAAQAAGVDVFGTMAHWTDEIFSLGPIRSDGAVDVPNDTALEHTVGGDGEFASLQEALDAYGITEVSEPTWVPEGYTFRSVAADYWAEGDVMSLTAEYFNGTDSVVVEFESYHDQPNLQVEKTDAPVETLVVNDITVYLLENTNNNAATWVTEHYECFIGGRIEKDELRQMVLSVYAD